MLINRKLLLLLITIVFLVGIQTTFATDINDTYTPDTTATTTTSQIQDIQTNTITHTQENIQTTTNDKLDTNDKQSDTNTITKTSKNSKTDGDTSDDLDEPEIEKISRFYGLNNITVYKNTETITFVVHMDDEDYIDFYEGTITIQYDNGVEQTVAPGELVDVNVQDFSIGEHIVYLSYYDETGQHPSNQTSFIINITELYDSSINGYFYNGIVLTNETNIMKINIEDNTYERIKCGNITFSIYDEDIYDYKIIKTIHDTDDEFINFKNNDVDYINIIDIPTIISYYEDVNYPISVSYYINYTDLSGIYANSSYYNSFDIYHVSNYIVEIDDVIVEYDTQEVSIPIIIKDANGNEIMPEFTINDLTLYGSHIPYNREGNFIIISRDQFYSTGTDTLKWAIQFEDQSLIQTTSLIIIKRVPHFNSVYDRTVYKDEYLISIDCTVYDDYWDELVYGDGRKVIVTLDGQVYETINLYDEYSYDSDIYVDDLSVGEHNVTLSFIDESGNYSNIERTFKIIKLDTLRTTLSVNDIPIIFSTDENVEIKFNVSEYSTDNQVTKGNVSFIFYKDDEQILLKTVDVNETELTIGLNDLLSYYDTINYPLYVPVIISYNDSTGEFQNVTAEKYVNIYKSSVNTVEVPNMEGNIRDDIIIPITVRDEYNNIINPDEYRVTITNRPGNMDLTKDENNIRLSTNGVYANNYTLEWLIIFEDGSVSTTNSSLILKQSMIPRGNHTIYKNQKEYWFEIEVYSYYDDSWDYKTIPGSVTIQMDGEIYKVIDSFSGYDYNCVSVSDLSIGEHRLLFIYEDENGNNLCNSTVILNKINTELTNINGEFPYYIFITDEKININFSVYTSNTYQKVNEGVVTLSVYDYDTNSYVELQTVNVEEQTFTINTNEILTHLNDNYPTDANFQLYYNNITDKYSSSNTYYSVDVYDKFPVNLEFNNYILDDDYTTFNISVKDYEGNDISQGEVTISGYDMNNNDVTFTQSSQVSNGIALITITSPNLYEYTGDEFYLTIKYHENNTYEDYETSRYEIIRESLFIEINDMIVPEDDYIIIPYVLKNKEGEILYLDGDINLYINNSSYNYYIEENEINFVSWKEGVYNVFVSFETDEKYQQTFTTFTLTVKKLKQTQINYLKYDINEDSTTFNFKVQAYDDDLNTWVGVNTGMVNVTCNINDTLFTATGSVVDGIAAITFDGLNIQKYVGQEFFISALYHDDDYQYRDSRYDNWKQINKYLTIHVNDTIVPKSTWTYVPVVLKDINGTQIDPEGTISIEPHGPIQVEYDYYNKTLGILYYGDNLGTYEYTLKFVDMYGDYETAETVVNLTFKIIKKVNVNYLSYDTEDDSTLFKFSVIDEHGLNVTKGSLNITIECDGEQKYTQENIEVMDGIATLNAQNFVFDNYRGSICTIYYNYTDGNDTYWDYQNQTSFTVKDTLNLTAKDTSAMSWESINTTFTLKDKEGNDVGIDGYITITDASNNKYVDEVYVDNSFITFSSNNINYPDIYHLKLLYNSNDGLYSSNVYIITVKLYYPAAIYSVEEEYVYNKTTDSIEDIRFNLFDPSYGNGTLFAYLENDVDTIEINVHSNNVDRIDLNEFKDKFRQMQAGSHLLTIKYISDSEVILPNITTTKIMIPGTSTINTDKEEYSYYSSVEDNVELTIYDESNNNGTVVVYLVVDDNEIPIMAYYNMQSESISLNSIAKQLESKYGYTQGDSANLKLVYNSDFKYLDISQTEFTINFVEEKLSITSEVLNDTVGCVEVKVIVTDDYINEPVSNVDVTIKLDDVRTVSAVTDGNGQVTLTPDVTFADQTYDIIAVYNDKQYNQTEEITIKQRSTEIIYTINNNIEGNVDIEISVVDKATGQKVSNADIKVTIPEQPEQTLTTDENGVKTINPELTPGTYEIPVEYPETINYTQSQNTIAITVQEEDNRIKELEEQLRQANDNITQLTQEVKDLNDTKNNLTNQLAQANDKIAQQNDTINNLNNNITQLEQQLANATKNITDLKDKLAASQANATQLKSQLDSVNASLNDAQQQIAQQEKTIDNLEKQLAQANNNITQLKSQVNDLNNTKTNLEKQLAQANNNITDLKDKLAASQANATQLDSQLKALNQTKNNLEKELNETNKNLTTAKEQINTLNNKVNDLNKQLTNAKNNITALNNTLKDLNNTINNQNKTIADQNKTINNQNKTINDLNKTINNQTKTIDNLTKQIENLTAIKNITLTVSATNASVGSTVTFTATLKESTGVNVNNGLVSFKVNGETLKDEQGNTIFAKVSNGKASIKYTAQKTWYNKNLTVMAAYSGHGYNECRNTTNNFVVTAGKVNLKIADQKSHENGENTQFVVTVTDDNGNPIKSGQVLIKINGVTLKDANGKTITAKVANGLAIFDYKIALSARVHDITAVYSEKGYQRTEAKNTLNVTKGEAFIRVDPIKTSSDTTQVTANIVNQFKVNVDSQVAVAFKLNGRTAARTTAVNGVINATLDTKFTPGTYLLEIIIGETGMYKSDRVTTTIIRS